PPPPLLLRQPMEREWRLMPMIPRWGHYEIAPVPERKVRAPPPFSLTPRVTGDSSLPSQRCTRPRFSPKWPVAS
ncbi:hypothetical protein TNCT_137711, partial [Trichonephila clavata]